MSIRSNPVITYYKCLGLCLLFSTPIIGAFFIINSELNKLTNYFYEILYMNTESIKQATKIQASEDTLLTPTIVEQQKTIQISPRSNPAVLLKIDSVSIEGTIVHGSNGEELLKRNFWHFPASAYPSEQGLSVIFGHRRAHLPPKKNTFYNLDKLKEGDIINIKLENEVWVEYIVINSEIVNPETLQDILNEQTDKYLLKLITCTPLGTDKQRLIVTAEKII